MAVIKKLGTELKIGDRVISSFNAGKGLVVKTKELGSGVKITYEDGNYFTFKWKDQIRVKVEVSQEQVDKQNKIEELNDRIDENTSNVTKLNVLYCQLKLLVDKKFNDVEDEINKLEDQIEKDKKELEKLTFVKEIEI